MLSDVEGFGEHLRSRAPGAVIPSQTRSLLVQLAAKRGLDIMAGGALLVLFAPLLLAIAIAVWLLDRNPVFYRQQRYGRGGVPFEILKFRSMRCNEPGSSFVQVAPADPRVTPLGAFLRRTSLDELPQLFNVLFGDMSLVGPRPHAISMEENIVDAWPPAARRLAMRPGMTGLAQIRGLRGPTSDRHQLRARLEADIFYIEGWTLWRDLVILIRTPGAWLFGRNAV